MFRSAYFVLFLVMSIIIAIQITSINAGGSSVIDWSGSMIGDRMVNGRLLFTEDDNNFGQHNPEEHQNIYYAAE